MNTAMSTLFDLPATPTIPVLGETAAFPVRRVFCAGRNYVAHALEMGLPTDKGEPYFFAKSAWAMCPSGATIPFALGSDEYHYEMELVVAIGAPAFRISESDALSIVLGYACGLDMTRRDLQRMAKSEGNPWDFAKDFENSGVIAPITRAADFQLGDQQLRLAQNGEVKQDAAISDMIFSVPELISYLSKFYHLEPGDLLYTGTPAGVGPIAVGDRLVGTIEGLTPVELAIGARE